MNLEITPEIHALLRKVLEEDIGRGDVTTQILIPEKTSGEAFIVAKSTGVLAGLPIVKRVYSLLDSKVRVAFYKGDGQVVKPGIRVARIQGSLRSILTGERVALNFLGHLSGIATVTRKFVDRVKRYDVKIMDTRKTIPGLRVLQKYAVRCGGGVNHRIDLSEAVMIKDNHLEALDHDWKKLDRILRKIKGKLVIIEVDKLSFLPQVIELGPDVILLDNMNPSQVRRAVAMVQKSGKKIALEVSGGVVFDQVKNFAKTGIDRISIGALTHSAPHLDFSLELTDHHA